MTTNCNDTCDAVDKLLLCYFVEEVDMWGSIPSGLFSVSMNYHRFKNKNNVHDSRNIFQTSTETCLGHYLLKVLMEILKSYLKELRPPKTLN